MSADRYGSKTHNECYDLIREMRKQEEDFLELLEYFPSDEEMKELEDNFDFIPLKITTIGVLKPAGVIPQFIKE